MLYTKEPASTYYGITQDSMRFARRALAVGWTWEQVMKDLQVTYEARKAYFERVQSQLH